MTDEKNEEIFIYLTKTGGVILCNKASAGEDFELYDVVSSWSEAEVIGREISIKRNHEEQNG